MGGTIAPFPKHQFPDNNGNPAVGYQLFTYEAGSSTKLATYTDADLMSSNTNPIVLDGAGRATIFLLPTRSYKFVLALPTDTDPPASPIWTVDDVDSVPSSVVSDLDVLGQVGENVSAKDVVYLSDGSGGKTTGRWYKAKADEFFSSFDAGALGIATEAITSGNTGTIRLEGKIDAMAGAAGTVYYVSASTAGAITATAPVNRCVVGMSDNNLALIRSTQAVYKDSTEASSSGAGIVNLVRNGEMDLWPDGGAVAPQYWTASGASILRSGPSQADTTTLGVGLYCTRITAGAGAGTLSQAVLGGMADVYSNLRNRFAMITARVKAGNGVARLTFYDGVTTTYSAYTTGTGAAEALRIRVQIGAAATALTVGFEVTATNVAYVGGVTAFASSLMPSTIWPIFSLSPSRCTSNFDAGTSNSGVAKTALATVCFPPDLYLSGAIGGRVFAVINMAGTLANNANVKTLSFDLTNTTTTGSFALFNSNAAVANNRWTATVYLYSTPPFYVYNGIVTFDAATGAVPTIWHVFGATTITVDEPTVFTLYGQSNTAGGDISAGSVQTLVGQS